MSLYRRWLEQDKMDVGEFDRRWCGQGGKVLARCMVLN